MLCTTAIDTSNTIKTIPVVMRLTSSSPGEAWTRENRIVWLMLYKWPFRIIVRKFEQCCTLQNSTSIYCAVKIWMLVQRKWIYLEGIFIGGDIRAQLPDEAKKFDQIDKTFKRVRSSRRLHLSFYPRDAVLARVLTVALCLCLSVSICLSQVGVLS